MAPFRTRNRAQNVADRTLLLAQVLDNPNEFVNVRLLPLPHVADFTTRRAAVDP